MALCNGVLVSYVKARAEDHIDECGVGFWQRGERCAAMFLASLASHIPIMLWQLATVPFLTFVLRVRFARAAIRAKEGGREPPPVIPPRNGLNRLKLWRYPRGTIPYDIAVGLCVLFFVVLPWIHPVFYGADDPLGTLLARIISPVSSA
jgi:hypothetical protein